MAGLFFDPLPIVARYGLTPISIDPNTSLRSIDACAGKLAHELVLIYVLPICFMRFEFRCIH
jgi:hypothetical protein